ncbi:hydrogenase assembly protein HupF [Marinobacterium iners]|jgi:hydrogenase expression/formation protein HypC|uniref:HypC/HybG/HupF family hydrogenase formation chaperone n=1 Tax=Marinobacterium iners TaxID=48076 RepID=UPI001A8DC7E5|nr:HypC/HybG/HupF family hydrogenase formation chaperone [Marinobacterium iners]QSR34538.1 hydrogenase assembly protein HupF [Marinobacterium iners]
MCLAVPVEVVALTGPGRALADMGGVRREIDVSLLDDLEVGDFVILHVGFALQKLDRVEAERTLAMLQQMAAQQQ